jgi:hypothetical protein
VQEEEEGHSRRALDRFSRRSRDRNQQQRKGRELERGWASRSRADGRASRGGGRRRASSSLFLFFVSRRFLVVVDSLVPYLFGSVVSEIHAVLFIPSLIVLPSLVAKMEKRRTRSTLCDCDKG